MVSGTLFLSGVRYSMSSSSLYNHVEDGSVRNNRTLEFY